MTIINQKSISGITSITFASAGDDLLTFHSNNGTERFRIDNSGNTKITAGIVTTLTVTGTTTLNGNLDLQDDDKILIGTGDDLQIYHNGSHSYIADEGSGELIISGSRIQLMNAARGEKAIDFVQDGAVDIYYDGSRKLSTKSDGIDVTGEVQCDSVDVDGGHINLESGYSLQWSDSHERIEQSDSKLEFFTNNSEQMTLSGSNLGIGENSPADLLHLKSASGNANVRLTTGNTSSGFTAVIFGDTDDTNTGAVQYDHSNNSLQFEVNNSERMRIHSGGTLSVPTGIELGSGLDGTSANTLDDYEEGTWTPVPYLSYNPSGRGLAASGEAGRYTKIGQIVHCWFGFNYSINSSGSFNIGINNLPFTVKDNASFAYNGGTAREAAYTGLMFFVEGLTAGTTNLTVIRRYDNGSPRDPSGTLVGHVTYEAAN